jgi:HEAT repeat protein
MIDTALSAVLAGKLAKSTLFDELRNGVVDFLADKAKDIAGDEVKTKIEALRSDAKLNKQIEAAVQHAAKRWLEDSPDLELVTAVVKDTEFQDLPSVRAAMRTVAQAPYHPIAAETLRGRFKEVLPARFEEERIERGLAEFLNFLREEFAGIPALQPTLQTFASLQTATYTAALPQIESYLNQLLTGPTPTEETLQDYLKWVIDQHRYLDPKGSMQTVRQVQVLLEDVYVSLQAEEEFALGGVDRKLYEEEIHAIQERMGLKDEEREDFIENLQAKYLSMEKKESRNAAVELPELTRKHNKLVILGDPGAGKTTLMRYLALRHAQAKRSGVVETEELGRVLIPLYLRIADYAEHADGQSLTDFLPAHICGRDHADKSLQALISKELHNGNCLILLDGLDEVIEPSQRSMIASQINSLMRAHEPQGNRLVVTSRVAGYRLSPLDGDIPHYRAQDMNDTQIERFLQQWCNAVERFQTPGLSPTAQQANAQKEIDGITASIENNAGVKRLATNPLLLRTLALIHRTGARLPQRRIELYKLAADTLIKDWQLARGIPEAALVNDDEATRLLSELAYWMHEHKPAGLASEGEVKHRLAEVKAELAGKDPSDPEILKAVSEFLDRIRQRTGLFVERAPKRFGFMHLTFEEYFTARWLVNKPKLAAKRIRAKLHRPRWEEPILLAIAFYGMNFDDVSDLIEEAILGKDLGGPSPYEDILHRDLFFAVRVLGDQDVKPALQDTLLKQFLDIWLEEDGRGKFTPVREGWENIHRAIENSKAGQTLLKMLIDTLKDPEASVRASVTIALGNVSLFPEAVSAFIHVLKDPEANVRASAAWALGKVSLSPKAVSALIDTLKDPEEDVRFYVVWTLGNAIYSPEAVSALIHALKDTETMVRVGAANALDKASHSPEAISALIAALKDTNETVRDSAANALGKASHSPEAISALIHALKDTDETVQTSASNALGDASLSPETVSVLIGMLYDPEANVRISAAWALRHASLSPENVSLLIDMLYDTSMQDNVAWALSNASLSPEAISTLIDMLKNPAASVRASAASALRNASLPSEAISALIATLKDTDETVRASAAWVLRNANHSPEAVVALINMLKDPNVRVRANTAWALGKASHSPEAISVLISALKDPEASVRVGAANALGKASHSPEAISVLIDALKDPEASVRTSAAKALRNTSLSPEAASALIAALKDTDKTVRRSAAQAIYSLALKAKGTIPKTFPARLVGCLESTKLEEKEFITMNDGSDKYYSGLDCLFDALLAVAEYPEVK